LLGQVHRNAQPQLVVAVQLRSVEIDRHFVQKWTNIKMKFCSEILEPTEVFLCFLYRSCLIVDRVFNYRCADRSLDLR
jgi:hypothetical protein